MAYPFWTAAAVTLAFAVLARLLRGVTASGAVAGGVVCFALYAFAGPAAFAALVSVFVLTWSATRLGYSSKSRLGVAERREGRKASQVLANLAVAGLCAMVFAVNHRIAFLMGVVAALSEAAADTVSSEIGQGAWTCRAFDNQLAAGPCGNQWRNQPGRDGCGRGGGVGRWIGLRGYAHVAVGEITDCCRGWSHGHAGRQLSGSVVRAAAET